MKKLLSILALMFMVILCGLSTNVFASDFTQEAQNSIISEKATIESVFEVLDSSNLQLPDADAEKYFLIQSSNRNSTQILHESEQLSQLTDSTENYTQAVINQTHIKKQNSLISHKSLKQQITPRAP